MKIQDLKSSEEKQGIRPGDEHSGLEELGMVMIASLIILVFIGLVALGMYLHIL